MIIIKLKLKRTTKHHHKLQLEIRDKMKTWYTAVSFAGLLSTAYTGHNTYDDDDDDGPGHCGGWKCKKCEGECYYLVDDSRK